MRGNGKVFISHTHEDIERCASLLAALDAWGVDYWFDTERLAPGEQLSDRLQAALAERDIFIRVCTASSPRSYWVGLELSAFRGLQLEDVRQKRKNGRTSIDLVLDVGYVPNMSDRADLLVDGANKPRRQMLADLRAALGLGALSQARTGISRRSALGLGAAGLLTAGALAGGAVLLHERDALPAATPYPKPHAVAFTGPTMDRRSAWYFKAGDPGGRGMGLALSGGVLYAATGDGLYALNVADGSVLWANPRLEGDCTTVPHVIGDKLYLATAVAFEGALAALRRTDGSPVWQKPTQSTFDNATTALAGNTLYMLTDDGHVLAYSTTDGSTRWRSTATFGKSALAVRAPVTDGTSVYVSSTDGIMNALSAADGTVRWAYPIRGKTISTATLSGGVAYFIADDQYLYAVNTLDGTTLWRYQTGSSYLYSPAISKGVVYIGATNDEVANKLVALDARSGHVLWQVAAGSADTFDAIGNTPVVSGDRLYVVVGSTLYAFSVSQKRALWDFPFVVFNGLAAQVLPTEEFVYFADGDHTLYALDATRP